MVNYRNRAIELIEAIRKINDAFFKEGAPTGSANYFKLRYMLVEQIHIGIGDGEDAYLARVKDAIEAVKRYAPTCTLPSNIDTAALTLADFALHCLEGGAR